VASSDAPIRIVRGLDIPIAGAPVQAIEDRAAVTSVALLGGDYPGLSPAMQVREGDRVTLGQPLFVDRRNERVAFTAPGCGVVSRIERGARRRLTSVVVDLEGDGEETFAAYPEDALPGLGRDQVADALLASGLWTAFRARPYGKVPAPDTTPHSIFVTAMDSNPLAARPEVVIAEHVRDFSNGVTAIAHLTDGPVFVCTAPRVQLPTGAAHRVSAVEFSGPHPSGLAGTHIHHLDPVGANKTVWHLGYQDVIAIGKLVTTGRLWTERVIALAGPAVRQPRLVRARLGASTEDLVRDELRDVPSRIVSGSVLAGRRASGAEAYLGRYHTQVSAIEEKGTAAERRHGEAADVFTTYSLASVRPTERRYPFTSALFGRPAPLVPLGGYERVLGLDILPTPLLRALLVGDTDMAQALGCLELDEEDVALCTFVCPAKMDFGPVLRAALTRIEKEG
jgi:Na+-transporting NADH:ubiquinone oxidoreductase subunit A